MITPGFGVDIVDLRNPRTRGRHLDPRFMERIFGEAERALVLTAPDPGRAVWRHWAAKEAAFKAIGMTVHPDPPPAFDHSAFEVIEAHAESATVVWEDHRIDVVYREDPAGWWVAAIGRLDGGSSDVRWTATDTEETAVRLGARDRDALRERLGPEELRAARGFTHALVRLAARTEVASRSGLEIGRLEIVNPPGPAGRVPPQVHLDDAPFEGARISLSHDGTLIAWATWVASDAG